MVTRWGAQAIALLLATSLGAAHSRTSDRRPPAASVRLRSERTPAPSRWVVQRIQDLLPEYEVIRQALSADVNGDRRPEILAVTHNWLHGYPPDLSLCVFAGKNQHKLALARRVALGKTLMLDASKPARVDWVTGQRIPQVIVPACGADNTTLFVLNLEGRNLVPSMLYSQAVQGTAQIFPKRGKQPPYIVEHWTVWNLFGDDVPPDLRGHVLARRTYAWDARAREFVLKTTEPDLDAEHRLSPKELRRIPGANMLLQGK